GSTSPGGRSRRNDASDSIFFVRARVDATASDVATRSAKRIDPSCPTRRHLSGHVHVATDRAGRLAIRGYTADRNPRIPPGEGPGQPVAMGWVRGPRGVRAGGPPRRGIPLDGPADGARGRDARGTGEPVRRAD